MPLGQGGTGTSTPLGLLRALVGGENGSALPLHRLDEGRLATAHLYGRLAKVFAELDARALR